jgi:Cof subfamily protein (haloacid dehalogenase superfamily)
MSLARAPGANVISGRLPPAQKGRDFRRLPVGDVPVRRARARPTRLAAGKQDRIPSGIGAGARRVGNRRVVRGVRKTVLAKEAAATADEDSLVPGGSVPGTAAAGANASTLVVDAAAGSSDSETASGKPPGRDEVKLIVTDVDGTLLNSNQELTLRVEAALARAAAAGVPTVLATGKSRGPWADAVLGKLAGAPMPGVFVQGCLTCDADGTVLESIELDSVVAQSVIRFAERAGASAVAFCGSRILCSRRDENTDLVLKYGEPAPEAVGPMIANVIDEGIGINKILLFCDEKDMPALREDAELMFENDCAITTAVPGMLEFLPMGASKGAAVARLLARMGVDPKNVLALGDGENDAEMLALAGTAVAMKGSAELVVAAARGVVGGSNDEDGVADAVEKYVLAARGLRPASEIKMPPEEPPERGPGSAKAAKADSPTQIKTRSIAAAVAAAERAAEEKEQKKRVQEMEKAKRTNAELLEASKAATARLAQLRGSLLETEAALASAEEEERLKIGSIREKAKQVASSKSAAFAEAKVADKRAAEAEARARSGGWGDDANAGEAAEVSNVDTWVIAAESEQREAVTAAAAAAGARAEAAVADFEEAAAADEAARNAGSSVAPEIVLPDEDDDGRSPSPPPLPSFASIGGFFAAALQTVSRLASPEARKKRAEAERAAAKASLLATVVSTNIGRDCDAAQLSAVQAATLELEALNPTKRPAASALLRGRWSAVFTNSRQLLGMDKKLSLTRQSGPVYMAHDVEESRSEWQYTWPVKVERASLQVTGEGNGLSMSFEQTKLFGLFGVPGAGKAKEYGELEITYLDLDVMLARGENQTVYVFVQTNSNYRIGDLDSGDVNRRLN